MKRAWLQPFTWVVILQTSRQFCLPKEDLHKPTSEGYERSRQLWEATHRNEMTPAQATDLCRRCHRLASFCGFNGHTFVSVIREVMRALPMAPETHAALHHLSQ